MPTFPVNSSRNPNIFFSRVLKDSEQVGYIKKPDGNARVVRSCSCCCYLSAGEGRGEKKEMLLISMMALFFSTLVGLIFTARSINSAVQASQDINHAERSIKKMKSQQNAPVPPPIVYTNPPPISLDLPSKKQPVEPPQAKAFPDSVYNDYLNYADLEPEMVFLNPDGERIYPEPASNVSSASPQDINEAGAPGIYEPEAMIPTAPELYYPPETFASAPSVDDMYLKQYEDALILLKGRRVERIWAASAQGLMTIGSGCVAVALLIYFLAEYQFFTDELMQLGAVGGGLVAFGMVSWMGKSCFLTNGQEKEAAERLRRFLLA